MERLTERYKDSIANTVLIRKCGDRLCKNICNDIEYDCSKCELEKALEKLATYEDLEEQGLLVRLPCKVGDDLYCIVNGEVKKLKVHSFGVPDFEIIDIEFKYVDGFKIVRFVGEVGKTVFLTREEAEKKLEEIQNDKT
jgi:hypothetical protein